jgi:hypothetical protein
VFKGMQLTLLWLNEVDTLARDVLNYGLPRVGRYPAAKDGGCAWSGVIADFNAPDVDNWTYDLLVNKNLGVSPELIEQLREQYGREFGINFHEQPGGRTAEAENTANLPKGYYERLIIGFAGNENKIRRFVDNKFGAVNNGQPVYPEFNDAFHVAKGFVQPVAGLPIHIGVDGGSTPAAVFGQEDESGQIRILAECVVFNPDAETQLAKMGPRQFGRMAREYFDRMWPNAKVGDLWGDPAMFYGAGDSGEDLAWAQEFAKRVRQEGAVRAGNERQPHHATARSRALVPDRQCRQQPGPADLADRQAPAARVQQRLHHPAAELFRRQRSLEGRAAQERLQPRARRAAVSRAWPEEARPCGRRHGRRAEGATRARQRQLRQLIFFRAGQHAAAPPATQSGEAIRWRKQFP